MKNIKYIDSKLTVSYVIYINEWFLFKLIEPSFWLILDTSNQTSSESSNSTQASQNNNPGSIKHGKANTESKESLSKNKNKNNKVKKNTPPMIFNCLCKPHLIYPFSFFRHSIWCNQRMSRGPRLETELWRQWWMGRVLVWSAIWNWKAHKNEELPSNKSLPVHEPGLT